MDKSLIVWAAAIAVAGCAKSADGPVPEPPASNVVRLANTTFAGPLEVLEDTCKNIGIPEGAVAFVDVMPMGERMVGVMADVPWITGLRGAYLDVPVSDVGEVAALEVWSLGVVNGYTPAMRLRMLKGWIWPGFVDLTFIVHDETAGRPCQHRLRVRGERRPYYAPGAIDGKYDATTTRIDTCASSAPIALWQSRLVASVRGEDVNFVLSAPDAKELRFTLASPTENMSAAIGAVLIPIVPSEDPYAAPFVEYRANVSATMRPPELSFGLTCAPEGGDPHGCMMLYGIAASKRIPSQIAIDNDYAVVVDGQNECGDWPIHDAWSVTVTRRGDRLYLDERGAEVSLDLAGGKFHARFAGASDDEWLEFDGSVAPPLLDYRVDFRSKRDDGTPCAVRYSAKGTVRHLP